MPLKPLLVIVGWELLTAHGAHLPVALNVFLKLALIVVRWKHQIAEWAFLVHNEASGGGREKEKRKNFICYYSINMYKQGPAATDVESLTVKLSLSRLCI